MKEVTTAYQNCNDESIEPKRTEEFFNKNTLNTNCIKKSQRQNIGDQNSFSASTTITIGILTPK